MISGHQEFPPSAATELTLKGKFESSDNPFTFIPILRCKHVEWYIEKLKYILKYMLMNFPSILVLSYKPN